MGSGAAEGKCNSCIKYLLVVFNIIFCMIGAGLVAVGTYAYIQLKEYKQFFGDLDVTAPAIVLILFGCITFIVAAIGCLGAFKESPCLLFVFAAVIGVLLCTEMICGGIAFLFRGDLQTYITESAAKLMGAYNESRDDDVKSVWDKMHDKLSCCGAQGRSDWRNISVARQQNGMVPESCQNYTIGCVDSFVDYAYDNILILGAVTVTFAAIQIFGIVISCMLGCSMRKVDSQS